jgi:integrase
MQNAHTAAEAASPGEKRAYDNNPKLTEIFDAYMAEKNNALAYRPCKHPGSLLSHIKVVRALWGAMAIEDFRKGSRKRVQDQVTLWRGTELTFATCRKRCTIMRAAFRHAMKTEIIERGQEPYFDLPPNSPPRERVIDPVNELPRLIKEADDVRTPHHTRTAFYLLLLTGVRRGALMALRWRHVDFDARIIRFRDTERAEDRSKKRRTDQPMNDLLYRLLSEAKERATTDAVIEWRGAGCASIFYSLKQLFKRAGCPDLRVHDLRRSSATFVYNGLEGNLSAAARHIADTEKMAEAVYVQKDVTKNLAGIDAISAVINGARASSKLFPCVPDATIELVRAMGATYSNVDIANATGIHRGLVQQIIIDKNYRPEVDPEREPPAAVA